MKISVFTLKIKVFSALLLLAFSPVFAQNYVFTSMTSPTSEALIDVWGVDNNHVFAVGVSGTFLKYDGSTWQQISTPTSYGLVSIWGTSANNVWMVGSYGTVLHYNGSIVSQINIGTLEDLSDIFGFNANDIYLCGNHGTFYHYNGSWTAISNSYANCYFGGMYGVANNDLYIVGGDDFSPYTGRLIHYNGSTFTQLKSFASMDQLNIWSPDNNLFYITGDNLYCYNKTTTAFNSVFSSSLNKGIYGFGASDILDVSDVGVAHYNGMSWDNINSSLASLKAIFAPNNDHANVYAVGSYGVIVHLDMTSGINDQAAANIHFQAFPNPAQDQINISFNIDGAQTIAVDLYNNLSQKVATIAEPGKLSGTKNVLFNVSTLPRGLYFIRATIGNKSESQKLLLE